MIEYSGVYRRRIFIQARGQTVSADVEDDPHRFGVDIQHDKGAVTAIEARALRTPFSTCAAASLVLQQLAGTPLFASPYAVLRQFSLRQHCTHMLDMAGLAVAMAARRVLRRQYDVEIKVTPDDDAITRTARIRRDGQDLTPWVVSDGVIVKPTAYAGEKIRRAASWSAAAAIEENELEAIFVIERAMLVSLTRVPDSRFVECAADLPEMESACFSFQPERAAFALVHRGSERDFTDRPEALLADIDQCKDEPGQSVHGKR